MKISAVRVFVSDIEAARRFYGTTLGLRQLWDHGIAVGYDVGATLIVEAPSPDEDEGGEENSVGRFVGCSLAVPDIEGTYRELSAKGVEFLHPPEKQPWGGTLTHFKDPSGNVLTLLLA